MDRWLTAVAVAAVSVLLLPSRADACSCVGGVPLCQSLWATDAVFSARVVEISGIPEEPGPQFMRRRVTLRVLEVWRGTVGDTVEMTTGMGGGDGGYTFQMGMDYLVYANAGAGGALSTSSWLPDAGPL